MNIVEYILKDYYHDRIIKHYELLETVSKTRVDLLQHGCTAVMLQSMPKLKNGGPGDHIWTLKAFNKNYVYKYNTRNNELKFIGVR